ncbi:Ionotropic receptor 701 [Blattella germanica]|nr:Ionotropic receptor 701 [Blattella germanica]
MKLIALALLPTLLTLAQIEFLSEEGRHLVYCAREVVRQHFQSSTIVVVPPVLGQNEPISKRDLGSATFPEISTLVGTVIKELSKECEWDLIVARPARKITWYVFVEDIWTQLATSKQFVVIVPREDFDDSTLRELCEFIFWKPYVLVLLIFQGNVRHYKVEYDVSSAGYCALNAIVVPNVPMKHEERALGLYTWIRDENDCGMYKETLEVDKWIMEGEGRFQKNVEEFFPEKLATQLRNCYVGTGRAPMGESDPREAENKYNKAFILMYHAFLDIFSALGMKVESKKPTLNQVLLTSHSIKYLNRELLKKSSFGPRLKLLYPRFATNYKIYVPCKIPNSRLGNIFAVFSWSLWLLISFVTLLVVVMAKKLCKNTKHVGETRHFRSVSSCLYSVWAVIVSVSVPEQPRSKKLRVFFISWVWFCNALSFVFLAHFTSFLIEPGVEKQISTFDELKKSNYRLLLPPDATSISDEDTSVKLREDMNNPYSGERCEKNLLDCFIENYRSDSKIALYAESSEVKMLTLKYKLKDNLCAITDYNYLSHYTALMYSINTLYKHIERALQHYHEAGLTEVAEGKILKVLYDEDRVAKVKENLNVDYGETEESQMYFEFTLLHLWLSFLLLTGGHLLSFVFLILEKIIYKLCVKSTSDSHLEE